MRHMGNSEKIWHMYNCNSRRKWDNWENIIFGEIKRENFPKLMKEINQEIQHSLQILEKTHLGISYQIN